MRNNNFFKVFSIVLIVSYLLSACAGAPAPTSSAGGGKPQLSPVVYTGIVESIIDDQWTINGITVTVDPTVVRDGPFGVGDSVKVEGIVNEDGSLTVSRVEAASPDDASSLPQLGDNDNANSNDSNSNDANSNNDNGNESNANEDNANTSNSNDDNSNTSNANDDNGNDANSNDDHSNDDGGANSNNDEDDNGNDSNSNDDDDSNSNDDDDDDDDNDNEDNSND